MSLVEIKDKIYELGNAWEEFKSSNNEKLDELNKRHTFDPLHTEKLEKIHKELNSCKQHITNLEIAARRPLSSEIEDKDIKSKKEMKKFINYLRTGELNIEQKSFNTGTPPEGFSLLAEEMANYIISIIYDSSPMRQLCSAQTTSNDNLTINKQVGSMETRWLERNVEAEETGTPSFDIVKIYANLLYSQPKAEQRLLDDSEVNLEKWIIGRLTTAFSYAENKAFIDGTGVVMPHGILSYSSIDIEQINSGINGDFTTDTLLDMFYDLREEYTANATYLMHKLSVQKIRYLKDAQDQYIWQPGLQLGEPDKLFGVPIKHADAMPPPATNSLSVALADFKQAYLIVDRIGISMIRDSLTEKPYVKFYTTKRVGGAVVNFDAIKLLKLSV